MITGRSAGNMAMIVPPTDPGGPPQTIGPLRRLRLSTSSCAPLVAGARPASMSPPAHRPRRWRSSMLGRCCGAQLVSAVRRPIDLPVIASLKTMLVCAGKPSRLPPTARHTEGGLRPARSVPRRFAEDDDRQPSTARSVAPESERFRRFSGPEHRQQHQEFHHPGAR